MIISVIKPIGPTSFDVVARVRKITGIKKIGHAGTLDPLASGILIVAIGKESTKQIANLVPEDKEYLAEITLGATSTTDDNEGKRTEVIGCQVPGVREVQVALEQFVGEVQQTPPLYSAVKVAGKRAYKSAREGKKIDLPTRKVVIKSIELLDYQWPILKIRVVCGKGAYIRSLARDIGENLKVGGYISNLNRIRVGEFTYRNSIPMDDLSQRLLALMKNLPQV